MQFCFVQYLLCFVCILILKLFHDYLPLHWMKIFVLVSYFSRINNMRVCVCVCRFLSVTKEVGLTCHLRSFDYCARTSVVAPPSCFLPYKRETTTNTSNRVDLLLLLWVLLCVCMKYFRVFTIFCLLNTESRTARCDRCTAPIWSRRGPSSWA